MGKLFVSENVLSAAKKRLTYIFEKFDHVYFSLSGGKDSGAMIQLADIIAQKMNKKFDLLILDIEANYCSTRIFIEDLKKLRSVKKVYHFCLPFFEDNTASIFQPQWLMWDEKEKEKWIQSMPKDAISLKKISSVDSLKKLYESSNFNPDKFLKNFIYWYSYIHTGESVACGIGIRAQESLNRYNSISNVKFCYKGKTWIKRQINCNGNAVNFYPIYDWLVEDVWGAYSKYNWLINDFYEKLYKIGVPLSQMRICQPYGLQQRKGLAQYALVEPQTWEKVVNRVSGANFGKIYSKTALLSHYKTEKPSHMTWQEYTVFLLETMGLYSRKMQDHYYRKISILINYYKENFKIDVFDIPEEASRKDWEKDEKLWHNWKGIAKALEKNDYSLSTRQYSLTKIDEKELYELAVEFGTSLGIENLPKYQLKKVNSKISYLYE
ncbi:DUF3440 domain-containing protein [Enterococcus faecalis]|uniref:DUF3440 domain-containing protein n=1 Tax=Enterococcus faecalis TaxID=1351 RepID=UPI003CC541DB